MPGGEGRFVSGVPQANATKGPIPEPFEPSEHIFAAEQCCSVSGATRAATPGRRGRPGFVEPKNARRRNGVDSIEGRLPGVMSDTKTILFATIVPLDLSSGGTVVCREHVRCLAADATIDLHVCAPYTDEGAAFIDSIGAYFIPIDNTAATVQPANWKNPGSKFSFPLERSAQAHARIDRMFQLLITLLKPDVIVLDYLYTALFVPSAYHAGLPVVMISLNRETEFFRDQRQLKQVPEGSVDSFVSQWRLRQFEREVISNSDAVVVLTESDKKAQDVPDERIFVVEPSGEEHVERWSWAGAKTIFFVGNIAHYPNYAATEWLCGDFAEGLQSVDPEITINIIGAAAEDVPAEWARPNVRLMGRSTKEEVLAQFCGCGLFIAPIANNFGSKIKVLECMSHGTPLVATSGALSGVKHRSSVPTISLNDPSGAVDIAVRYLGAPDELHALSNQIAVSFRKGLEESESVWPKLIDHVIQRGPFVRSFRRLCSSYLKRDVFTVKIDPFPENENIIADDQYWASSYGFYPLEAIGSSPIRWTKPRAAIYLFGASYDEFSFMRVKIWELAPPGGAKFRLFFNENVVLEGKVLNGPFEQMVVLPNLKGVTEIRIRIESDEQRFEGDSRVLGVALETIAFYRGLDPAELEFLSPKEVAIPGLEQPPEAVSDPPQDDVVDAVSAEPMPFPEKEKHRRRRASLDPIRRAVSLGEHRIANDPMDEAVGRNHHRRDIHRRAVAHAG